MQFHMPTARTLLLILLTAGLAGCGDDPVTPVRPTIVLTPGAAIMEVGEQRTFAASVQNGSASQFLWRSANPVIASVSAAGVVTAHQVGQTQIRALLAQDTTVSSTAEITVEPGGSPITAPDTMPVVGHGVVLERYTGEVAVRGDWAYTSTWSNRNGRPGNAIKIWNVSGAVPILADSLIIVGAGTTGDVQISDDGGLLVVAKEYSPGYIVIYDRTNPARPEQLSTFGNANTTPGVHTVKLDRVAGRHYAFLSVNPGAAGARLVIVDITDPRMPVEVWAQVMGRPYVHDVFVRDGLLFAALWDDGMRIFDIGGGGRGGSPSAPVVMGNVLAAQGQDRSYIHNIWWFHDPVTGSKRYAFLGAEGPGNVAAGMASGDIHVIDVTDMSNPRKVAVYFVSGAGTHNFSMDEQSGILYAAYYNGGVRALDVRGDLGTCTDVQKTGGFCDLRKMNREVGVALLNDSYVWGVAYQGNYVYASDMRLGLFKLDVSRLRR
ncbi:hypothetical protein BH23GEM9_BH23GEM9_31320 [soil metagenome]